MSEADSRVLQHLYASARQMAVSQPALASLAGSRLFEVVSEKKITLPDATKAEFCTWCKSPFVPGINCSVNVQSRSKVARKRRRIGPSSTKIHDFQSVLLSDSTEKRRNYVVYECHICKRHTRFPGATSDIGQAKPSNSNSVRTPSTKTTDRQPEPAPASISSKARKKRRKDLQTLISSSKHKNQEMQEKTFSLEDFLGQMN